MKLLTTLLIALLAALGVYAARRRIWFAIKTGAIVYMVLLPLRLLFAAGSLADDLKDMVWPIFFVLLVWAVLWWVSTSYERRKLARRR
jgi:positive regulator of sigma E activity